MCTIAGQSRRDGWCAGWRWTQARAGLAGEMRWPRATSATRPRPCRKAFARRGGPVAAASFIPMGPGRDAGDVADVIVFLPPTLHAISTGQCIAVDGRFAGRPQLWRVRFA